MAKSISPADLGAAIERELTTYHRDVLDRVNAAGTTAVKTLVKRTKATAPKKSGSFRRSIASKEFRSTEGNRYVWYVKAPNYRLTHLLVHGHAKRGGGRVEGDPFLENALAEVLPQYEEEVKEAVNP